MSNYLFINQEKSAELLVPLTPVDYNLQAQNDRLIYVPLATRNNFGVVKIGDGLTIEHGLLSFDRTELDIKLSTNVGSENAGKFLSVSDNGNIVFVDNVQNITKVSELENDVGFITSVPSEYVTESILTQATSNMLTTDTVQDIIQTKHFRNDMVFHSPVEFTDNIIIDNISAKNLKPTSSETNIIKILGDPFYTLAIGDNVNFNNLTLYSANRPQWCGSLSDPEPFKDLAVVSDIPDISNLANQDDIPTKVSELENDVGFITTTVDNLVNYYLKTEQYTKEEINELVSRIPKFDVEVVEDPDTIPEEERSETTIYLVPRTDAELNDYYEEIIWIHNTWERLGSTRVNLSDYYTKNESNLKFVSLDTIQTITGRKNFETISFENVLVDDDFIISTTSGNLRLGSENTEVSFISTTRPRILVGENLTIENLAFLSDIPTVPTRTSQLTNDSAFITQTALDLNYFTAGEVIQEIETEIGELRIPTKLSELSTDANNQRVSSTEKTTWNNKSNFSGNYNDLTNKPNMSNYLTASGSFDITGSKTFVGSNLQIAPTAGAQPTYIEVGANHDTFKVRGMYNFINLDDSGTYPVIEFLNSEVLADTWGPQTMNGLKTFYNQGEGALRINTYNNIGVEFGGYGRDSASVMIPAMTVYKHDGTTVSLNIPADKNGTIALLEDIGDIDTSSLVDIAGTQTITGAKTFTGTIMVPDVTIS